MGNIVDSMHARYYSPYLARFLSVDPVGGRVGSSQSWNRYSYVLNNPIVAIDPNGEDTFYVNRKLGGEQVLSRRNLLSHTFVVTTENGKIENTYSWGNDPDPKNEDMQGRWFPNESEDIAAAQAALDQGLAQHIGDESLDSYVDEAFSTHADDENDPSNHWNLVVIRNCKTEAKKLIREAKKRQKEAQKEAQKEEQKEEQKNKQGN